MDPGNKCSQLDSDPRPVRYSAGRVETRPVVAFALPSIGGLSLNVEAMWASHTLVAPATRRTTDTQPTMHSVHDNTHFLGQRWIDNTSDRLVISGTPNPSDVVTWRGMGRLITFTHVSGGVYKDDSGAYTLEDRGGSSPSPRWIVSETSRGGAPSLQWGFDELTVTGNVSSGTPPSFRIGYLVRRAVTANPNDYVGYYSLTINRTVDKRVSTVVDSLGRELIYIYEAAQAGSPLVTMFYRLKQIVFRPASGAAQTLVASFLYTELDATGRPDLAIYLDKIVFGPSYRRFLYLGQTPNCGDCKGLLRDVIGAVTENASVPAQSPKQPSEVYLETHGYETTGTNTFTGGLVRAFSSSGALGGSGQAYRYVYSGTGTTQFDLQMTGGPCASGSCPTGYQCYSAVDGGDDNCYVSNLFTNNTLMLNTGRTSSTGPSISRLYYPNGSPKRVTDEAGVITTYGYGSNGQLRCLVRNDNDDEAFTNPLDPDGSTCDPAPSGSQVVSATTTTTPTGTLAVTTTPSILGGGNRESSVEASFVSGAGSTVARTEKGYTSDVGGTIGEPVERTSTTTYDSHWRPTRVDGPLANATSFDVTDISYYADSTANNGHVHQVKRYVGASAGQTCPSCTVLTTTYSQYDAFGVPHRVTRPNGDYIQLLPSADRLEWWIDEVGSTAIASSVLTLYPDGNVRSFRDPDYGCLTYEYSTITAYLGVPTVIKHSDAFAGCGVVPIDSNSGEVEVRTYVSNDPRRLESIVRRNNGVTEFTYSDFGYDLERRLVTAGTHTSDSSSPYAFGFSAGLPTSTTAPEGPGHGTWKTTTDADSFGRPTHMWRWLSGAQHQEYTFQYSQAFTPRPTTLTRGLNGIQASTSTFEYDDFGALVTSAVPEQGTTRFEYDDAGRLVKERVWADTPSARTAERGYDSVGRLLSVDHDTEHPVACASAPAGTKIQDEEYKYDTCVGDAPAGVTCASALGRLTIDRTILQCGTSGQVVKRGRWYSYDGIGRLASLSFATMAGSSFGAPATMSYTYTGGSRVSKVTSPLNAAYPTEYWYSYLGRPTFARTGLPGAYTTLLTNFSNRAMGPMTKFDTGVTINGQVLRHERKLRSDDALSELEWSAGATFYIDQTFGYTPAGLIKTRTELANVGSGTPLENSRYYEYDAILRMTCEARGQTTHPTEADCTPSSPRMRSVIGYYDGSSATMPPDVRSTVSLRGSLYPSSGVLQQHDHAYANGSGKVLQVNRTGGTPNQLVLGYDPLGRRVCDYDSFDPTRSRRDYTYLPNGQLGSVSGQSSGETPYSVAINYDNHGRPLTMSEPAGKTGTQTRTYELFWDDASRLVAAEIRLSASTDLIQWHYHYLGSLLVAATRTIYRGGTTTVQRFWFITDERGLIYRAVTNTGVEHFRAKWDASGWRAVEIQTGGPIDMWVPFGLPGQIILHQTSAFASDGTQSHTRPPLALNMWRSYDPMIGALLQADPMDRSGRRAPEGYQLGRNNLLSYSDSTGKDSNFGRALNLHRHIHGITFDDTCDAHDRRVFQRAYDIAIAKITICRDGICSSEEGRRGWRFALSINNIHCRDPSNYNDMFDRDWSPSLGGLLHSDDRDSTAFAVTHKYGNESLYSTYALNVGGECLASVIAHESLHGGGWAVPVQQIPTALSFPTPWRATIENPSESFIESMVDKCFDCEDPSGMGPTPDAFGRWLYR